MDNIKSLDNLIESLKGSSSDEYVKMVKNMTIPLRDFDKYIHWSEKDYTRNCIIKTERFELILICWKKNAITSIHGHDNQRCWIYQVDGEMTEIRYKKDSEEKLIPSKKINLIKGKVCYMQDSMGYHRLENESSSNSITLHLYAKPILKCEVYNSDKAIFEERILNFDTIEGKIIR